MTLLRAARLWIFFTLASSACAFAEEGGKELTIEEFLQSLSTVQGIVQRKDPFAELAPPFELTPTEQAGGVDDGNSPVIGAPVP